MARPRNMKLGMVFTYKIKQSLRTCSKKSKFKRGEIHESVLKNVLICDFYAILESMEPISKIWSENDGDNP